MVLDQVNPDIMKNRGFLLPQSSPVALSLVETATLKVMPALISMKIAYVFAQILTHILPFFLP
jgi:hypothetical protein